MTTLRLCCPVCDATVHFVHIEEWVMDEGGLGFTDIYECEHCDLQFARQELDEEWDSSFDLDDSDYDDPSRSEEKWKG